MQIDHRIYVVGSGWAGYRLTEHFDCDVYLIDCGGEQVLIDAGAGIAPEKILEQIRFHGFSENNIRYLLITHGHGDHVGGAAELSRVTGARVLAHPECAGYLRDGDQNKMSVALAAERGLYPEGFRVEPCAAEDFRDGKVLKVGDVTFTAIDTPGHCSGHNAYLLETPEKRYLFSGDSIFLGGNISLQNIWDCNIQAYAKTAERLERVEFEALLPSHFGIDLSRGKKHIQKAAETFRHLDIPGQASKMRS